MWQSNSSVLPIFTIFIIALCVSSHTIKQRDVITTSFEDDWLRDLESQILTGSQNGNETVSIDTIKEQNPVVNIPFVSTGRINYENAEEVVEPLVVTAKPYLTGQNDHTMPTPNDNVFDQTTEAPESTESLSGSKAQNGRSDETAGYFGSIYQHQEGDNSDERLRKILDKILADIPEINDSIKNPYKHPEQLNPDDDRNGEVKTFVVLIRNQTPMIILACILSTLVLIAVIVTATLFLKKLNERSAAITLIAHYEYDDITGQTVLKQVHQDRNHQYDPLIGEKSE